MLQHSAQEVGKYLLSGTLSLMPLTARPARTFLMAAHIGSTNYTSASQSCMYKFVKCWNDYEHYCLKFLLCSSFCALCFHSNINCFLLFF